MTCVRFACNGADSFDLFALPSWVERERDEGRLPGGDPVSVEVVHLEREMDGSCRWCGCRENEVVVVEGGRLA